MVKIKLTTLWISQHESRDKRGTSVFNPTSNFNNVAPATLMIRGHLLTYWFMVLMHVDQLQ